MKDGMYAISFAGQAGVGVGTLVFDGGRIFGADAGGGKYDGAYEFNENTGKVDVKIRVELPANRPSVIGVVNPFDWALEVSTELDPDQDSGEITVLTNLDRKIAATYAFLRPLPAAA